MSWHFFTLKPGNLCVGICELGNNELFGHDRLIGYVKDTEGPPWGKGLLDEIRCWRGHTKANDDLTILEVWRDRE